MNNRRAKTVLTFFTVTLSFTVFLVGLFLVGYLKVLPKMVSCPKVISYVEGIASKSLGADVKIVKPFLKTSLSPRISLGVDKIEVVKKNNKLINLQNFSSDVSFDKVLDKEITLDRVYLKDIYVDVSKLLALPIFSVQKPEQEPCDWKIKFFNADIKLDSSKILYNLDKDTLIVVSSKDVKLDGDNAKKFIHYVVNMDILKGRK